MAAKYSISGPDFIRHDSNHPSDCHRNYVPDHSGGKPCSGPDLSAPDILSIFVPGDILSCLDTVSSIKTEIISLFIHTY